VREQAVIIIFVHSLQAFPPEDIFRPFYKSTSFGPYLSRSDNELLIHHQNTIPTHFMWYTFRISTTLPFMTPTKTPAMAQRASLLTKEIIIHSTMSTEQTRTYPQSVVLPKLSRQFGFFGSSRNHHLGFRTVLNSNE